MYSVSNVPRDLSALFQTAQGKVSHASEMVQKKFENLSPRAQTVVKVALTALAIGASSYAFSLAKTAYAIAALSAGYATTRIYRYISPQTTQPIEQQDALMTSKVVEPTEIYPSILEKLSKPEAVAPSFDKMIERLVRKPVRSVQETLETVGKNMPKRPAETDSQRVRRLAQQFDQSNW